MVLMGFLIGVSVGGVLGVVVMAALQVSRDRDHAWHRLTTADVEFLRRHGLTCAFEAPPGNAGLSK